nr:hypothetical protein GCM10020185_84560 [Pseudomonas brassicacearum subsp. brassicacearum]
MSARRVAIVSAAYTPKPGSSRVRQTFKEMIVESAYQALNAIKMHPRELQAVAYGYHGEGISEYGGLGPTISDALGISPAPHVHEYCQLHQQFGVVPDGSPNGRLR